MLASKLMAPLLVRVGGILAHPGVCLTCGRPIEMHRIRCAQHVVYLNTPSLLLSESEVTAR